MMEGSCVIEEETGRRATLHFVLQEVYARDRGQLLVLWGSSKRCHS